MINFWDMAKIQVVLLVYLLVGYYVRKRNIISAQTRQELINLLLYVLMPCMVFESFNQQLTSQQLLSASIILAVAFGISIVSLLLGKVIYNMYPPERRCVLQYGTLVSNSGFAGLPLVNAAYGSQGLFYGAIFIIPNRIFMWSAGVSFFAKDEGKKKGQMLSVMLNPSMIAVYLGVVRLLTGFALPEFLDTAMQSMGNCTTSLSMIMVGAILADIPIRQVFDWGALYLSVVRLMVIPGLTLLILKLTGFDPLPTAVAVCLSAMPVGTTTALLAERYGADSLFGSKCVFMTTALSLITVPILTIFL